MSDISFDGVKKYMDTTLILKNITFLITEGEKVGLVGENGSGKSTILKLIAGILKLNHCAGYPYAPVPPGYDEGWVKLSKGTTCAYLEQIPHYEENLKVNDILKLSFEEVYKLEREMQQLEISMQELEGIELQRILAKYSELVQLFEMKGGYEVEEKLNKICKGLKFSDRFLVQDFRSLSGGEKTTVILGKLLIDSPDALLLDEPTNHLDMDSVEWLESYIRNYKGIVVVVSHDRYFLDHTATKIIEIEDKLSKTYFGNYSDYTILKEELLQIQLNNYKEQNKKIDNMEQSIKELRGWAMKANNKKFFRRAASMQLKLDKMEQIEKPQFEKQSMKMNLKAGERSGNIVLKATNLSKNFGTKTILRQANLLVQYGERVALIGPNGSGKTTFLKMLLGEIEPDSGEVSLGVNVRMAYLPQNLAFENEELTILDYFRENISVLEGKAREHLAKFMFYGTNVFKKIKLLSGGERVRLKLSKLTFQNVNLLILDEPTNHLDTASIESVEKALFSFKGTIFFISHDRYFINKISERIIAIEGNTFISYLGNYDEYREQKEKMAVNSNLNASLPSPADVSRPEKDKKAVKSQGNKKDKTKIAAEKENQKNTIERKIKEIENQIKDLDECMEAAGTDYEELNRLYIRKEELKRELDTILEKWISG